jgi:tetratricopeptide (TPR) repeat protein
LWKTWFAPGSQIDYYPLEQTVLWVEWQLWHNDTLGYHVVTLVLHLLSALLVWRLLGKMGLRLAWLGGLLFAIHPVQVESAAWIAELKNTLSLPPLLLAMCCYLDYEERGRSRDYLPALALFLVALLCKITVVMFPVVILLYAWWKRGRIGWNDLKVSAPFFVLSLTVGLITILGGVWDRQFNHMQSDRVLTGGWPARLVLAGQEIAFYFSKSVLPVGLLPVYPKWAVDPASPVHYLPWLILGGVVGWLWTKRESWGRHALLGLGFFLINLTPCPGFIPAPNMGYAWTMDHFLYLPIIGLIGLVVAVLGQMEERLTPAFRRVGVGIVALVMILLAWESHGYAGLYINSETLWTYTLQGNPEAWPAHSNLGLCLQKSGRVAEAMEHYEQALRINPDYAEAHNNMGVVLLQSGRVPEAIAQDEQALRLKPDFAEAHNNLGNALLQTGRIAEAIKQYQEGLRLNPDYTETHNNMGNALLQSGQMAEAIEQYEQALQLNPDNVGAHNNLGNALRQSGRMAEAIEQYEQALRLDPDLVETYNSLGLCLQKSGRVEEAIKQYQEALQIKPDYVDAHNNLGIALFQKGRVDEAIAEFQQTLRLKPNYPDASYNLGFALFQKGQVDEAIAEFQQALRLKPNYPEALSKLGIALFQKGQVNEGIAQFQKALQIDPDFALAHYNLGIALFQKGQLDAAIAQVQEAVRLNPADSDAQNALVKMKLMATQRATQK